MTLLGPLWFVPLHEAINAFKAQRLAMLNERVSKALEIVTHLAC